MLRVGFEVRLTVRPGGTSSASSATTSAAAVADVAAPGEEDDVSVVLTRSHARALDLDVGSRVWLAPNRGATTIPVVRAV
jgi:sulfate transport system ATP-binding protein